MDERPIGRGSLVSAEIFVEGGGDSNFLKSRCRDGFRSLLEKSGFKNRMPKIHPSGDGGAALKRFRKAIANNVNTDYLGLLIDSEDPVDNINRPWDHLSKRSGTGWRKPEGSSDDQLLFMTTSMETWIAADREALRKRFPRDLNENRLPGLTGLEARRRDDVFTALERSTNRRYTKGQVSFELLGCLNPDTLEQHLPSFRRARKILNEKLES